MISLVIRGLSVDILGRTFLGISISKVFSENSVLNLRSLSFTNPFVEKEAEAVVVGELNLPIWDSLGKTRIILFIEKK